MSNELKSLSVFENVDFGAVRTVLIDEVIYFVGNDVAKVLEYKEPHKAISTHCKGGISYTLPTKGGIQETKIIPESDLYRLIFKAADQSKNINIKEKAEKFEKWIFEEVLPTIRKHGAYITDEADEVYVNNELRFGKTKTIKTFANAQTHEITNLYSEFRSYVDNEYKRETDQRLARYKSVEKGLEMLLESTASIGFNKIGDCYNIKLLKEQVIIDRTTLEKRISGGEKGFKTKTIKTMDGNIKVIKNELVDARNKVSDLEVQLENSIPYPTYDEFITLNYSGFSNNYMYEQKTTPFPVKSDAYTKWLTRFPYDKMPSKEYWDVDWEQPLKIFLEYVAVGKVDVSNLDKSTIDTIITKYYGVDDNILHDHQSKRIGTCNNFSEGKIRFYITNI